MRRATILSVLSLAIISCKSGPDPLPSPDAPASAAAPGQESTDLGDTAFSADAEAILDEHLQAHPNMGVGLGLHEHDGKLPDVSADGLKTEQARLEAAIAKLEGHDVGRLSPIKAVERAALLTTLENDHFKLTKMRAPQRNPMFYMEPLTLTPYVSLEYAEPSVRAKAIAAIAGATPAYLEAAKANLDPKMPRTFIETALLQVRGTASFALKDVSKAFSGLPPEEAKALGDATRTMAAALEDFAKFLEDRKKAATDDYALGAEMFSQMLRETQGIDVDLGRLEKVLQADLDRNLEALEAAAKQIDPKAPTAKVVARVQAQKPGAKEVLSAATAQSGEMRKFLVDKQLITIPTDDPVEVAESPPFMRWNAAFLGGAGPFEKDLPYFYYISPPDPKWPKKKQKAYIPGEADLLFITIHEVWPGHFLHGLHVRTNESRILKSLWNYAMGEGWAHYTEEMMWDEGISEDPKIHIGQLQNALLRNVRALSALGLHTKGMTVEQSKKLFLEQAFQDEANAEQQAVRGTFDPMYLSYTVGKLAIMKMRDDLEARDGESFSLRKFHDDLLSYGSAPLSAVRTALVGDDALL